MDKFENGYSNEKGLDIDANADADGDEDYIYINTV